MPADMKPIAASARRLAEDHQPVRAIALRAVNDTATSQPPLHTVGAMPASQAATIVNLAAALIAIRHDAPMVLTTMHGPHDVLPATPYHVPGQLPLEACLRDGVAQQTAHAIGHAEQLLAFADGANGLAVGYMALTRASTGIPAGTSWRCWYDYLPWEDWRRGRPAIISTAIEPRLRAWASEPAMPADTTGTLSRSDRARMAFGLDRVPWNEERVAARFELLAEAGLLSTGDLSDRIMRTDHMRILANAIGRLRAKLKTRPVIFELMDTEFTLFELQKTVEAILGPHLHKQNFRRLIESAGLVEPTGEVRAKTGGRPAKLFRFRHEVLMERPAPGVRVHTPHA